MTARPQDVALLPCPFCGGRAKSKSEFVRCVECGAQMNFGDEDGLDSIISSWNRRSDAALASAQAREEELRAEVAEAMGDAMQARAELKEWRGAAAVHKARAERLAEALRKIATVAHAGGSVGMSEADALTAIRKLTLKHWDRNAEPKHVRAALSTNAATQTGETT